MRNNYIRIIWLICITLTSLALVGCFHIPNEDRLPNKNKTNTWNTERDIELEQTVNSFINSINLISSQINENKGNEIHEEIEQIELKDNDLAELEDINTWYEETIEEKIDNIE